jgi:hypothetical protein
MPTTAKNHALVDFYCSMVRGVGTWTQTTSWVHLSVLEKAIMFLRTVLIQSPEMEFAKKSI